MMQDDELYQLPVSLDLRTSAEILGISKNTAYEMVSRDEYPIKVYKVGNRYRVTRSALLAFLGLPPMPGGPDSATHRAAIEARDAADAELWAAMQRWAVNRGLIT